MKARSQQSAFNAFDLYTISLADGGRERVRASGVLEMGHAFSADGKHLVFAKPADGSTG